MTAVRPLLSFEIDGFRFGVHLESVQKVVQAVEIQPVPDLPNILLGVINVHGNITPVLNTRKRLGLPEKTLELSDFFVIANEGGQQIALIADSISGVINYTSDQISNVSSFKDSINSDDKSVTVLRVIDGLLSLLHPDLSLSEDQWSTIAIVLRNNSDADASGN